MTTTNLEIGKTYAFSHNGFRGRVIIEKIENCFVTYRVARWDNYYKYEGIGEAYVTSCIFFLSVVNNPSNEKYNN